MPVAYELDYEKPKVSFGYPFEGELHREFSDWRLSVVVAFFLSRHEAIQWNCRVDCSTFLKEVIFRIKLINLDCEFWDVFELNEERDRVRPWEHAIIVAAYLHISLLIKIANLTLGKIAVDIGDLFPLSEHDQGLILVQELCLEVRGKLGGFIIDTEILKKVSCHQCFSVDLREGETF